jgi:hypothetical protein
VRVAAVLEKLLRIDKIVLLNGPVRFPIILFVLIKALAVRENIGFKALYLGK